MYKEAIRSAWAEINLSNLEYNVDQIMNRLNGSGADMVGVIKADAYGHGAVKCAEVLRAKGVKTFAVATIPEGIELRNAGADEEIICLGLTDNELVDYLVEYDITPVINSLSNAEAINDSALKSNKTLNVFIAVDTGMGRIGYQTDDIVFAIKEISEILTLPNINVRAMISHFATADAAPDDMDFANLQIKRYNEFYDCLKQAGIEIPARTFANSAAIMRLDQIHYDMARAGIILYGGYPSPEVERDLMDLKPVMSIKACISKLKTVSEGDSCSYGRKFIASGLTRIATVPVGYADGFPRPYSQVGSVIVNGVLCPIAGNICMDQFMVDVTEVPDVNEGDEVILMGSDGINTITAEDIGSAIGTINYEIMCGFGQRLPKIYVKNND